MHHRIANLRKSQGMSQQQLANALHISPSTVGMYEQGRRIPSPDALVAIASLFHVTLDYLVTGAGPVDAHTSPERHPASCCKCCRCKCCPALTSAE